MTTKLRMLMGAHNTTLNSTDLIPIALMTLIERSVPIRNRVMVNPFWMSERVLPVISSGKGRKGMY